MKLNKLPNEKGFSIIELLVVLVMVFLISTLAFMQIYDAKSDLEVQNVTSEFRVYLERARFDSVKRRASEANKMAKVVIKSPTSFTSNTDLNQNGVLEITETREIDFSHQKDITFYGDKTRFPVSISFNNRGQTIAIDGKGKKINPVFLVCRGSCEHIATDLNSFQIVSVSPTGTVTILRGDELLEAIENPDIKEGSTNAEINAMLSNMPNDGSILDVILGN